MDVVDGVADDRLVGVERPGGVRHRQPDAETRHPDLLVGSDDRERGTPSAGLSLVEPARR
ncbi:hypothetical protein [Halorubrum ezzemoulense]|uniref:hypothetical protein n=1 Tax=Halorubrum ezzemoulense TaxID=337243 RepID=UPI0015C68903|nr:hypothetical protein [Halorubrum ezzemoulense]